jgi:hypothetical protein
VVLDILGVLYDVPVPNEVPPVKAPYQFNVPALAVAPNVTVPVPHTEPGVVPDIVGVMLSDPIITVSLVEVFAVSVTVQ